jgi:maltose/moltooligosaccharide transporter
MPNSPSLWVAAGMLWIMDASINISMEPFRAYVGDMLPEEQRTFGFTMQSFFIGIGAFVASWLPHILTKWFGVANTAADKEIPDTVKYAFYLGGIVFLLAVLWTVIKGKEYSPEQLKEFENESENNTGQNSSDSNIYVQGKYLKRGIIWSIVGIALAFPIYYFGLEKELYILAGGLLFFGLLQVLSFILIMNNRKRNGLVSIITDLYKMPKTMQQLAVVQFFSWFALFSMWIYTTSAVTKHIYHTIDTESEIYNEGANLVSGMFGWYNLFAAGFGLIVLPYLAKFTNRKVSHLIALCVGGIGLASIYFISNPQHIIFSMIGIGMAWASILSIPYAILTGSLPQNKMGVYMGIFNFFIVIPQILAASILGVLVKHIFAGETIYALMLGGCSMVLAGIITLFVTDKH